MPVRLEGSCRCGAVCFAMASHTPQPYQLCYCSICRKTAGGGGYAINLMGTAGSLEVTGREGLAVYQAEIEEPGADGVCRPRPAPGSAMPADTAPARSGCSTRAGPSWSIPSPRRSTASCRCHRRGYI